MIHQVSPQNRQVTNEPIQKSNRLLIAGVLVITMLAIPVFLYSLSQSPQRVPDNVSSDFSISIKPSEQHEEYCRTFVDGISHIDGVPIQDIQELAEKYGLYGKRTFKDKLFDDCLRVQKMGTSNEELADHLQKIYSEVEGFSSSSLFSYNPALQRNSTIGKHSQEQSLKYGDDILFNNCVPIGLNIFEEEILPFNCHAPIENLKNKVHIRVTDQMISRIRQGVYDGFNPVDVGAVLTGHSVEEIVNALKMGTQKREINFRLSTIIVDQCRT